MGIRQFVYILVSSENDLYYQQALISTYSLRKNNPDSQIIVLCDKYTADGLKGDREEIKQYISQLKIIEVPSHYNQKQKSRWLKTSMRSHISGNFLFIDCDTVVVENVNDIFNEDIELGAVYDLHTTLKNYPLGNSIFEKAKLLGFSLENETEYFNSGILLVKDTPMVHTFFQKWHSNWIESCKRNLDFDQPTLALTNIEMGHVIKRISDEYNCQLKYGAIALGNAKIIHYFNFSAEHEPYVFMNNSLLEGMKGKRLKDTVLYQYINAPKTAFIEPTMIIGIDELKFIYSPIYILFKKNVRINRFSYYFLMMACRVINKINDILYYYSWRKIIKE